MLIIFGVTNLFNYEVFFFVFFYWLYIIWLKEKTTKKEFFYLFKTIQEYSRKKVLNKCN